MTDIDTWLAEELRRGSVPFSTAPVPAGAPYRSRRHAAAQPWFAARMATRTGVVLVAAAFGLMATGALAAAAVTGTADPKVWTLHVSTAISSCTGQGATSRSGRSGGCLDAVIHYRGPKSFEPRARDGAGSAHSLESSDPEATNGDKPAGVKKGGPDSSPGTDPSAPYGHPAGVPLGPATDPTHGRPSGVPVGPSTAVPTPQAQGPTVQPSASGNGATTPATRSP